MDIANMTRGQLEGAIVEYRILPLDTPDQVDAALAMSDSDMRAAIQAWIEAGDECAAAK
jgi:hypothetical protein